MIFFTEFHDLYCSSVNHVPLWPLEIILHVLLCGGILRHVEQVIMLVEYFKGITNVVHSSATWTALICHAFIWFAILLNHGGLLGMSNSKK